MFIILSSDIIVLLIILVVFLAIGLGETLINISTVLMWILLIGEGALAIKFLADSLSEEKNEKVNPIISVVSSILVLVTTYLFFDGISASSTGISFLIGLFFIGCLWCSQMCAWMAVHLDDPPDLGIFLRQAIISTVIIALYIL